MSRKTFLIAPRFAGLTPNKAGDRLRAWFKFIVGQQEILHFINLPKDAQERDTESYQRNVRELQICGLAQVGGDVRRIAEIPALKLAVSLTIEPETDPERAKFNPYRVYINDPNVAPRFKGAAQDQADALAALLAGQNVTIPVSAGTPPPPAQDGAPPPGEDDIPF